MKMTKQAIIFELRNELHTRDMKILELERQVKSYKEQMINIHRDDCTKLVYALAQSNEAISKAILGLKGVL